MEEIHQNHIHPRNFWLRSWKVDDHDQDRKALVECQINARINESILGMKALRRDAEDPSCFDPGLVGL